jgi:hypothetical protein
MNLHRDGKAEFIYITNLLSNLKQASILFGQFIAQTVDLIRL